MLIERTIRNLPGSSPITALARICVKRLSLSVGRVLPPLFYKEFSRLPVLLGDRLNHQVDPLLQSYPLPVW